MTAVFDATPLIYLAKADRRDVIESFDGPRLVPQRVYREVVTDGIEAGYDDACRIEQVADDGALKTVGVDVENSEAATRLRRHPGLSDADVAVLACADTVGYIHVTDFDTPGCRKSSRTYSQQYETRDAVAVIDEAAGRSAAEVTGIETRGTAYLVLSAVKSGQLSLAAGRETIDAMIECGWYVAPDPYTRIVQKLESFE